MSAASRTIQTSPDLRPVAALGGFVLAGAILVGLVGAQVTSAPKAAPAPDTAPIADHGWSSAAAPLTAPITDHGWSSASSTVAGSGRFGFSKAANLEK